jgi:23S rRNA-/tRNA-specific pseudouridylate synthase
MLGHYDAFVHVCQRYRFLSSVSRRRRETPRRHFEVGHHDADVSLPLPTVLYSNNHLLVVNKPAGWHSVPNHPNGEGEVIVKESTKCLVTKLKSMRLGGGSQNTFLLPLHRIDQPCTGILMLGKTSKAASRITTLWKQKHVEKEYVCVVPSSRLGLLLAASTPIYTIGLPTATTTSSAGTNESSPRQQGEGQLDSGDEWHELQGLMLRQNHGGNKSVIIMDHFAGPLLPTSSPSEETRTRKLSLQWRVLNLKTSSSSAATTSIHPAYTLIQVRTFEGARHMVRALLAQIGHCPIEGDLRYHQQSSMDTPTIIPTPLKDRSVALHAFRIRLDSQRLKLGSLETFEFEAPIPATWNSFFGIQHDAIFG